MSVTAPRGFRAAGVTAGLKASGRPDVALVVNDGPDHHVAAVFTGNRVEAAPVTWSRTVVLDGRADAVVLNSGGANACTGAPGSRTPIARRNTWPRSSVRRPVTWSCARPGSSASACRWISSCPG